MASKRCEHCGKSFDPVDPDEGFCSLWCQRMHDRDQSTVTVQLVGESPLVTCAGHHAWGENWIRA